MKTDELWRKYARTKDRNIRQLLIEEYIGLVKIVAGRMYNFYGSKIEYEDLVGFGVMGLIDSIERFDISKNIKFETYAQIRIKGTIIDNIRKLDWIPRTLRKKSKDIQNGMISLENKLGRTPTKEELSDFLCISVNELESILADTTNFNIASLEDLLVNKGEYYINNDKDINTPEDIFEKKEIIETLGRIIDELKDNEKIVISLYYYEELTYKEIGHIMELSESRISQIHSKAILNIKNKLKKLGIYENWLGGNNMYKISPNIIIEISKDGLKGYITLIDDKKDSFSINQDILDYELDEKPIEKIIEEVKDILKVGLNEEELRILLSNGYYNNKVCIAEGILPINGKDGHIKYNFNLDKKLVPKILQDGTVNYRELNIVNNVRKGDVLAELIPPREGKNGYKVTGQVIPYKRGKTPVLRYGKNVKLLDNGTALVADKDGLVELKGNKVIVLDVFEVENVDNKVGNIYFNGTVIVNGSVLNGFQVKADGDVRIKGVIEGGYIENTGDVIVRQGIQGYNKLTVKTKGHITTRFIENSVINSGGTVTAEAIMHSHIYSKYNIVLIGKRGLIVGGICRAGKEIHARTIGSSMATKTILEVGVDPEVKEKNEDLKKQIDQLEENLDKVVKSLNLLDKLKNVNRLDEKKAEMYIKLLKTKNSLLGELIKYKEEYRLTKDKIDKLSKGRIKVSDTIYPGVRIIIGNSTMTIRDEMKRCSFYREEGEIRVGPY